MSEPAGRVEAWMEILGRIEESLGQSLRLAPEVAVPPRVADRAPAAPLERLDRRFEQWSRCLEQIERQAAAAEAGLDADEAAVRDWHGRAARAREMLAERAAREL